VEAFESEFASYVGADYARALGNATQGLHLALTALNVGVGDEVVVTAYSWISSASCILMQNAVPVFADCDPKTLALSAETIEPHLTERTKAIIVVHLFGYPADMDPILDLAERRGIPVIEDASHAHGALYRGRKCGSMGDMGVFSLHQRKTLSVGDGGIITTNSHSLSEKIYRLRSFGDRELSYNYRMTEFAGALGTVQLQKLDEQNALRQESASILMMGLAEVPGITVMKPLEGSTSVYYRVILDFDPNYFSCHANEFVAYVQAFGVPLERTWAPLHRHPHFNPAHAPARGLPWNCSEYDGVMSGIDGYRALSFPAIEDLCDHRIMELAVNPPVGKKEVTFSIDKIFRAARKFGR
jgi:dTDP-4-amino-4,6-dideoxygalactose transaminase